MVLPGIVPEVVVAVAVIVARPPATAAARPLLSILAANALDELQMTLPFKSWLVPSEYSPKAVNCWVNPTWILGLTGATKTEARVADVTLRVVLPEIVPEVVVTVAVMVAVPGAIVVAKPLLLTVATDGLDELQVTRPFRSWLVPSEYTPEAANWVVSPAGTLGLDGVTDMEAKVAEVTVRVALAGNPPEVAVMVAVPGAMAVARPWLSTVATDVFAEAQVTCAVRSVLVPSEYAPEAENCWVTPTGMLGLTGVTEMENRVAEVTVTAVAPERGPEIFPELAVMTTTPAAMAVPRPLLLTVAKDVLEEVQVTRVVIS